MSPPSGTSARASCQAGCQPARRRRRGGLSSEVCGAATRWVMASSAEDERPIEPERLEDELPERSVV